MLTQSRSSASSAVPTTTATTRWPHSASGTPKTSACSTWRCSRSRSATAGTGIFTPPLITTSSMRPTIWSRPSSSKRPASEVRNQPSTTDSRGELRVVVVVAEERRTGDPDPAAVAEGDLDPVERPAVVDAPAGGLGGAVGGDDVDPGLLRPRGAARRRARRRRRAPCGSARARRAGRGCRGCGAAAWARATRRAGGVAVVGRGGATDVQAVDDDGLVAGDQGPDDHLHPGDVRRRQRQQPAAGSPQPPGGRLDAGDHARRGQHHALGPAGRAGRLDQQRVRGCRPRATATAA